MDPYTCIETACISISTSTWFSFIMQLTAAALRVEFETGGRLDFRFHSRFALALCLCLCLFLSISPQFFSIFFCLLTCMLFFEGN